MAETFNKKEKEKKRQQKRQEKEERKAERKANAKSGQDWESMMAYVDENGNISSTPPDIRKRKTFKAEDMQIGVPKIEAQEAPDVIRKGVVSYFNESKGFGFINDQVSGERVFVHINQLTEQINENDKVTFNVETGFKGLSAVNVKRLVK